MRSLILQLHNDLKENKITKFDLYKKYFTLCKSVNNTNSMITYIEHESSEFSSPTNNLLDGIPYVLKDNIDVANYPTTSGSQFLSDYISPYSATVYHLLHKQGAVLIGKTNLDEFGMGGTGCSGLNGYVKNLHNLDFTTGGSSSGSVNLVGAKMIPFSLGTDTGDSVRRPSSFCNSVGFKPTYGLISRYGVSSYMPSLDTVGVITTSVCDAAIVCDSIFGFDKNDFTSQNSEIKNIYQNLKTINKIRIGIFKNIEQYLDKDVKERYLSLLSILKKYNHELVELSIDDDTLQLIGVTYRIVSYHVGSSCWSNLTGVHFGKKENGDTFEDIATKSRSKYIAFEAKKRFVFYKYITNGDNYERLFAKVDKVRRYLSDYWINELKKVDCLLFMGACCTAPSYQDVIEGKSKSTYNDDLQILANFSGSPSITIPCGFINKMPIGININCLPFTDQQLLNIALTLEEIIDKEFAC